MPEWVQAAAEAMSNALMTTLLLSLLSVVASVILGYALGTLQTVPSRIVKLLVRAYVEFWRGLPTVVTLFFIFYLFPVVGIDLDPFTVAVVGLTLWGSANVAEVVRGAVQSVDPGQTAAASALGFNWLQMMIYVILPQAAKRTLPPLVGLIVILIQSTALAAVIGTVEVLEAAQRVIENLTFTTGESRAIPILGAVLGLFFVICFPLSLLGRKLERRFNE